MKKLISSVIVLLFVSPLFSQNILIANNNPGNGGGTNVYSSLQAAIDAAGTNDIIQIVAGTFSHGNVTITKKDLTIVGIGLNPDAEGGAVSLVGRIAILEGADNIRITGVNFGDLFLGSPNTPVDQISNVVVENSKIGQVTTNCCSCCPSGPDNFNGVIINNNVIDSNIGLNAATDITITNNIIHGTIQATSNVRIEHNLIRFNQGTGSVFVNLNDAIVKNNIFYGRSPTASFSVANSSFIDNISYQTSNNTFPSGSDGNTASGNQEGVDPLFVNVPFGTTWDFAYDYSLQPGSPAINAAEGGTTDVGLTGGPFPFDNNGNGLPIVQDLVVPFKVVQGSDMEVTVKGKGN